MNFHSVTDIGAIRFINNALQLFHIKKNPVNSKLRDALINDFYYHYCILGWVFNLLFVCMKLFYIFMNDQIYM